MLDDDSAPDTAGASPAPAPVSNLAQGAPTPRRPADHRPGGAGKSAGHRQGRTERGPERCVALIDARFWWWLHEDESAETAGRPADLLETVRALVQRQCGAQLLRIYWYSDSGDTHPSAGVVGRRVLSNAQDGGLSMLRAMAQELAGVTQGPVERVLLVSDDERLVLAVDEAQRRGLLVDMLVDAQSQDLNRLREDDPSWSRLLLSADQLLVLGAEPREHGARTRGSQGHGSQGSFGGAARERRDLREGPSAESAGIIESELLNWWGEEDAAQREHWRHELQGLRGIPQELDRLLLLRISRRLGQALSPAEKNAMRAQVRQQVLGGGPAEGAGAEAQA